MLVCVSIAACEQDDLEIASQKYRSDIDCESLKTIFEHIYRGMAEDEVILLLGEPYHSPTKGLYYYDSNCDREVLPSSGGLMKGPVGMVVDYRNDRHELTDRVQKFWMGPIGE